MIQSSAMASSSANGSSTEHVSFELLNAQTKDNDARLGCLYFRERPPLQTPHYLAISSRGCVPHITQDMMRDQTSIRGIYAAFEDCASSHSPYLDLP